MSAYKYLIAIYSLAACSVFPPRAEAGEVLLENLKLTNTYIRTTDAALEITGNPADTFSATTVNCPQPASCVLAIEMSGQFGDAIPANTDISATVFMDGVASPVVPTKLSGMETDGAAATPTGRLFKWVIIGVSPGTHSVQLQLSASSSTATCQSSNRTLKIDVYGVFPREINDDRLLGN